MHTIISGRVLFNIREAALSSGTQGLRSEAGMISSTSTGANDVMEMKRSKRLRAHWQSPAAAESLESMKSPGELDSGLQAGLANVGSFPF
jgi:hypothetical protein